MGAPKTSVAAKLPTTTVMTADREQTKITTTTTRRRRRAAAAAVTAPTTTRPCVRCSRAAWCELHASIRWASRDDIPSELWLNQHVLSRYRPPHLPLRLCVYSILLWNNETVNVWSHLLGFLFFSWAQWDTNVNRLPAIGASLADHLALSTSALGAQLCMAFSAIYHTFGCRSVAERRRWLKLDVFGIAAGLVGMYLNGVYISFYCHPTEQHAYLWMCFGLLTLTAYVAAHRDYFDRKIIGDRFGLLHLVYLSVSALGAAPTAHWVQLNGGLGSEHVQAWLPNLVVVYALCALAFFFYASMLPERLKPGAFDLVGCSHQWWHLLVLAAMAWWQRSGVMLLIEHRSGGCRL